MKISEMNNRQAREALIRLADPISNLCDDEELADMFKEFSNMGDVPMIQTVGKMIPKFALYAFEKHINDLYEIVGALTMQSRSQVEEMNFMETVKVIKDSYDDVLASFFTRLKGSAKKKEKK